MRNSGTVIFLLILILSISLVLQPSFVFATESPLGESTTMPPSGTSGTPTNLPSEPQITETKDARGDTLISTVDPPRDPNVSTKGKRELTEEELDYNRGLVKGVRLAFLLAQRLGENETLKVLSPQELHDRISLAASIATSGKSDAFKIGLLLGVEQGADLVTIFGVAGTDVKKEK
jgi:hypothetical protein